MPKAPETLPALYPIVDVDVCARAGRAPRDVARAFIDGGARLIQLRAKALASGAFLDLAVALVEDAAAAGGRIIVNDRADIAALARAAGVHVGQEDLPPAAARLVVGDEAIVGFSTHTTQQLDAAAPEPLTYVAVGPIFGTGTKNTGYEAVGYELVRYAARGPRPVVAIGGITLENAPSVIEAGAASVAVISDLLTEGDPADRVRAYIDRLSG